MLWVLLLPEGFKSNQSSVYWAKVFLNVYLHHDVIVVTYLTKVRGKKKKNEKTKRRKKKNRLRMGEPAV